MYLLWYYNQWCLRSWHFCDSVTFQSTFIGSWSSPKWHGKALLLVNPTELVILFIVIFLDWWEIQFDQIWSILDRSDPKKIKNITGIFILSVNVTTIYCNIFRLMRNQIWSNLIHFGQIWSKKNQKHNRHFYPFFECDNLL